MQGQEAREEASESRELLTHREAAAVCDMDCHTFLDLARAHKFAVVLTPDGRGYRRSQVNAVRNGAGGDGRPPRLVD